MLGNTWNIVHASVPLLIKEPSLKQKMTKDKNKVKVAYVGHAREEKGFHLLPEITGLLKENSNIEFLVNGSSIGNVEHEKIKLIKQALIKCNKVIVSNQSLSHDDYFNFIE